jgi:hypothetical protein
LWTRVFSRHFRSECRKLQRRTPRVPSAPTARRGTVPTMPTLPEHESMLRDAPEAMGPAPCAELLHKLELADFRRAEHIGELWSSPKTRSIANVAIDAEEDRLVRALLITMLREREHRGWYS